MVEVGDHEWADFTTERARRLAPNWITFHTFRNVTLLFEKRPVLNTKTLEHRWENEEFFHGEIIIGDKEYFVHPGGRTGRNLHYSTKRGSSPREGEGLRLTGYLQGDLQRNIVNFRHLANLVEHGLLIKVWWPNRLVATVACVIIGSHRLITVCCSKRKRRWNRRFQRGFEKSDDFQGAAFCCARTRPLVGGLLDASQSRWTRSIIVLCELFRESIILFPGNSLQSLRRWRITLNFCGTYRHLGIGLFNLLFLFVVDVLSE